MGTTKRTPSRAELYEIAASAPLCASWARHGSLRDDASTSAARPRTIDAQWADEGDSARRRRLLAIFDQLSRPSDFEPSSSRESLRPPSDTEIRRTAYARELWTACGGDACDQATWQRFETYALAKERDLFALFADVDRNGDGVVDRAELRAAMDRAGVDLGGAALEELFAAVDRDRDGKIHWEELRDAFLVTMPELVRFHQSKRPTDRHVTTLLTPEGDFTASDKAKPSSSGKGKERASDERDEAEPGMFEGAGKFLLAGGIAGAVSRTATAPFDRLKIYLITHADVPSAQPELAGKGAAEGAAEIAKAGRRGMGALASATHDLYAHGGLRAFWTGNELNMVKIFPESAIKFTTYESMKRVFARAEGAESPDHISSASRFIAGGIGGMTSQSAIYWLETLKTRVMAIAGTEGAAVGNRLIASEARKMWREDGLRAYHRGLTWAIVGVVPYSGIDMMLFEIFKARYTQYTGQQDLGTVASLCFGACSGGIGATVVYPLNLVRTRLQAQGTPSHPQRYSGIREVIRQTMRNEGLRGFYRGLSVTLSKVGPSMAISWAVFEKAKHVLELD